MEQSSLKSNGTENTFTVSPFTWSRPEQFSLNEVAGLLFTNKKKPLTRDNSNFCPHTPQILRIPSQRVSTSPSPTQPFRSKSKRNPQPLKPAAAPRGQSKTPQLSSIKSRCFATFKQSKERLPLAFELKRPAIDLPGGARQEIRSFSDWFSTMKTDYLIPAISNNEIYEKSVQEQTAVCEHIEKIFSVGIVELCKQVSVGCNERGTILREMFEFHKKSLGTINKIEQVPLVNKISSLYHQLELVAKTNQCSQQELLGQIHTLQDQAKEHSTAFSAKLEEVLVLRDKLTLLERERFLVTKTSTKRVRSHTKDSPTNTIRPVFSRSAALQDDAVLTSFFCSQGVQVAVPRPSQGRSTMTESNCTSHCTQTEDSPFTQFEDPDEMPLAIIVTTETNQSYIEYAVLPSQTCQGGPQDSLVVPTHLRTPGEDIKVHVPNPAPFTNKAAKPTKKPPRPRADKTSQTDRDLLLETEETEILSAMINYKREMLQRADQELVLAKSKLAGLSRHHTANVKHSPEKREEPQETDVTAENTEQTMEEETTKLRKSFTAVKGGGTEHRENKKKHPCAFIVKKIVNRQINSEKFNSLTKKMVLKKIDLIYSSAVSRENTDESTPQLAEFCYDFIQSKHQETLIGEKQFIELLCSSLKNADSMKIADFLKLAGVAESIDLENPVRPASAFRFYIALLGAITRSPLGLLHSYHSTSETIYIPLIRAIECFKGSFSRVLPQEHVLLLCSAIENVSKIDPLKINPSRVVSQDFVLNLALDTFERHSRDVVEAVNVISQGFDLENKGEVHMTEFLMVLEYLFPSKAEFVLQFFPTLVNTRGYIPVETLIEFCLQNAVVSIGPINEFFKGLPIAEIQVSDYIKSLLFQNMNLLNKVTLHKEELGISADIERLWKSKITLIDHPHSNNKKPLYLAFTIFVKELQRLSAVLDN